MYAQRLRESGPLRSSRSTTFRLGSLVICGLPSPRSEEHTSELQSRFDLVCRLLLEKKKRSEIFPAGDKERLPQNFYGRRRAISFGSRGHWQQGRPSRCDRTDAANETLDQTGNVKAE